MTIFMSLVPHRYYREVQPGEIVQISKHGVKTLSVVPRPGGDLPAFCIFEYVYFARPDSIFEGMNIRYEQTCFKYLRTWLHVHYSLPLHAAGQMVYTVRQRCGRQLAIEAPTDADVVSTVPESATPAALGYAQQVCLQAVCSNSVKKRCRTPSPSLSNTSPLLTVWTALRRSFVQEPLRWENIHPAKYTSEAAWSCKEVWGFDRQLCRETSGIN